MTNFKYVILGGGLAAGYAAKEFANNNIPEGKLCMISADSTLPYQRPPLSKDFLAGEETKEDILISDPDFYEDKGIAVKLDTKVSRVDLDARKLYTNGDTVAFEKLLIATGARPRKMNIPGSDLANIFYLRQVEDARQIRRKAENAEKAVVIGGSFIGMESAAVLQSGGVDTTMVFRGERVWHSFFTAPMSNYFEKVYRDRGVTLLPETEVTSFLGDEKVKQVITSSGESLPADLVIVGIGVVPNTEIFRDSGLKMANEYIKVNRFLETNLPDVLAAGDVTKYKDVLYERTMHVEHWDNAVKQGRHEAQIMLGQYQPYEHVPYFFSDVFDLSYEFWGDTSAAAEIVHRGDVDSGSFSVWWLAEDGRLLAAFVMDRPEEERELAPEWIKSRKQLSVKWLQGTRSFQPDPE